MDLKEKEQEEKTVENQPEIEDLETTAENKKEIVKKTRLGLMVIIVVLSMVIGYFVINKIKLMVDSKKTPVVVVTDPNKIDPTKNPLDPNTTVEPTKDPVPTGKVLYKIGSDTITDTDLAKELSKIKPPDFEERMKGAPEKDQKVYRSQMEADALRNLVNQIYLRLYLKDQKINITDADLAQTKKELTEMMQKIHDQQNTGRPFNLEERLRQYNITNEMFLEDIKNQTIYRIATKPTLESINATESEAKDFFVKHPELYNTPAKADLKHILLTSEADADIVINELKGGADFTTLAKTKSQDPQAQTNGGALGWIENDKNRVPSEILNVIFDPQVKLNTPLKIRVETQWYVMIVSSIQPEVVKSYSEMKDKALFDVKEEKRKAALEAFLKKLESKYGKPVAQ